MTRLGHNFYTALAGDPGFSNATRENVSPDTCPSCGKSCETANLPVLATKYPQSLYFCSDCRIAQPLPKTAQATYK